MSCSINYLITVCKISCITQHFSFSYCLYLTIYTIQVNYRKQRTRTDSESMLFRNYKQQICLFVPTIGIAQPVWWQDVTIELSNTFSTSAEAFLLSKHMTYSITLASQGSVILPSLAKPNSSWNILRSSWYTNGTSKRLPSAVYMTQCPLIAIELGIRRSERWML